MNRTIFTLVCIAIGGLIGGRESLAQDRAQAPALIITSQNPALTINSPDGRRLVVVDMKTGKATLYGNPNEAARRFWDAVGAAGMARCKP